ncbi:hypothetical protein OfM1_21400 [Lactovum odontotermitis]
MDSNITAAIISFALGLIGVVVSTILSKRQIAASNAQFDRQKEFEKNGELRKQVAVFLAEITSTYDILKSFLEKRREFEVVQRSAFDIVQNGGNLDYILGSDPRKEMEILDEDLNSLRVNWGTKVKNVEDSAQEILLYFDKNGAERVEELVLYAPQNLKRYNWVFLTNFPEDMLRTTFDSLCGDINIPKNIEDIRSKMREILNK